VTTRRIPIEAAKDIADKYGQNQVVIVTFDKSTGLTHVVTYGKSVEECAEAAQGGNFVKRALGWPESLCNAKPKRADYCKHCRALGRKGTRLGLVHKKESVHYLHDFEALETIK